MAIKKKVIKTPAVRVETRKLSQHDTCGISFCHKFTGLLILILFLINMLLIVFVLVRQEKTTNDLFGWKEQYKIIKQIQKTDMFQKEEAQKIEQLKSTLNIYTSGIQPQENPQVMPEELIME